LITHLFFRKISHKLPKFRPYNLLCFDFNTPAKIEISSLNSRFMTNKLAQKQSTSVAQWQKDVTLVVMTKVDDFWSKSCVGVFKVFLINSIFRDIKSVQATITSYYIWFNQDKCLLMKLSELCMWIGFDQKILLNCLNNITLFLLNIVAFLKLC
jgi:hypothetical protein